MYLYSLNRTWLLFFTLLKLQDAPKHDKKARRSSACTMRDLLLSKVADEAKLRVFLSVLQQLRHCVTQVKQHVAVRLKGTHTQ